MPTRIISFNIQRRKGEPPDRLHRRMQLCAEFIKNEQPELLCLQEVLSSGWETLQKELAPVDAVFSPRTRKKSNEEGVAVCNLSPRWLTTDKKIFWLSPTPDTPSRGPGAAHPRVCCAMRLTSETAPPLWVFTVHFDHRSRKARRHACSILSDKISEWSSPADQVLICGDFNMSGSHPVIKDFLDRSSGWTDAADSFPVKSFIPTYLGWGVFKLARARIDLCLMSPRVTASNYRVLFPEVERQRISDHCAIQMDILPKAD